MNEGNPDNSRPDESAPPAAPAASPAQDTVEPALSAEVAPPSLEDIESVQAMATAQGEAARAALESGPRFLPPPPPPLVFSETPHDVHPALLPRTSPTDTPPATKELLLYWCVGVLIAWTFATHQDGSGVAPRWILFACMTGFCLVWPAFRLSQDRVTLSLKHGQREGGLVPGGAGWSVGQVHALRLPSSLFPESPSAALTAPASIGPGLIISDWFHLLLISQIIIWPLHYQRGWMPSHTLCVQAAFALWSLLVAGIVALGIQAGPRPPHAVGSHHAAPRGRMIAMACCIALVFAEPVLMFLLNVFLTAHPPGIFWSMRVSPIESVWRLSFDANEFIPAELFQSFATVGFLAAAVWMAVAAGRVRSTP